MKRLFTILSVLSLCVLGVLWSLVFFSGPKGYTRVVVEFDEGIYPILPAEINQVPVRLLLNLGTESYMGLDPTLVEKVGAYGGQEEIEFTLSSGRRKSQPIFSFKELTIGGKSFRYYGGHTSDVWTDEQCDGELGLQILERTNLLLNFPSKEVIFFHGIESLAKAGIKLEEMQCLPLLDFPLLMVECQTDLGPKRAIFHTYSLMSRVNIASVEQLTDLPERSGIKGWRTSHLVFGGQDFGAALFEGKEIADELSSIDLILGLDFLMDHVVCIDYVNRRVYINGPQKRAT